MIKRLAVMALLLWGGMLFGSVDKNSGAQIFKERGCAICHAMDTEMVGPSIRTIGMRYSGNENGLVTYLKGQAQPIVHPERDAVMRPQLMKIGNLYEEEYRSLARHLIQAFMRTDF